MCAVVCAIYAVQNQVEVALLIVVHGCVLCKQVQALIPFVVLVEGQNGLWEEGPPHSLCWPSGSGSAFLTSTERRGHCSDG